MGARSRPGAHLRQGWPLTEIALELGADRDTVRTGWTATGRAVAVQRPLLLQA
jgi:hypothetical protein